MRTALLAAAALLAGGLMTLVLVDAGDRNATKVATAAATDVLMWGAVVLGSALKRRMGRAFSLSAAGMLVLAVVVFGV